MDESRGTEIAGRLSLLSAGVVVLLGGIGLAGWLFDVELFRSFLPGLATMQVNAAISLVLLGAALLMLHREPVAPRLRMLAKVLAGAVAILGALTLVEGTFGRDLGIDQLLFRAPARWPNPYPGRMAPLTAISLLLLAFAILLRDGKSPRIQGTADALGIACGSIGLVTIVGYVYSANSPYQLASATSMALHTAVALLAGAVAFLSARPRSGVVELILSRGPGGVMARRLLPVGLTAPVVLGWFWLSGQNAGYYGTEVGLGLMVIALMATLIGVVLSTARALELGDHARRSTDEYVRDTSQQTQSDTRYRGLLEAAPDAMVVVNQAGEIVLLNVQAEKQFGYRRDELVGQKVKNIIPEGFAERLIADGTRSAADALAQQIGTGIELSGRRKDGSAFPIEIMLSPLESAEGILVTAAIRNISLRKDAEKHLAQMEGQYRGLLEAAPDAMVVVNQAGEIVLLNVQAEKRFGYRRHELLGQKVTNIIPEGFAERLIADGTRSAADALAQQIGTGIELSGLRKDGSAFPIEIMLSPLENTEGILVTAAIRDISVRRAAERHLAQMEGRYRGLLEAAPDAMVVVNQGGEIVLLNVQAEKQFGYRRDELVGQKVKNIIPEGFAERLIADALRSTEDALAQQIGAGIELIGRRKNASAFPIEIMLSPLESSEGILVTAAIRDITTRKRAEAHLLEKMEELNRSNEELGQFAYIASHDLQEPLRMVASYTQLLSKRYKGKLDADADDFIAFAVDGASRMQRLIQDLLAYSRVGTKGKTLLNTSSEDALQQALLNLRGAIEESGASVTHDVLPMVLADETQLIQLFQNLVGNGIKYKKPGIPHVHVAVARQGETKWLFSVKDNGLGIDPQYFERIFGMFQRLHKREEFAGTGIGLAICKKIVERHGDRISVESQLGHGSTFRFALAGSERFS